VVAVSLLNQEDAVVVFVVVVRRMESFCPKTVLTMLVRTETMPLKDPSVSL